MIPLEEVPELQVGGNGTQDGTQERILRLITQNPKITRRVMADKLNMSIRTLQRRLHDMPDVQYVGTGAHGHWEINN